MNQGVSREDSPVYVCRAKTWKRKKEEVRDSENFGIRWIQPQLVLDTGSLIFLVSSRTWRVTIHVVLPT